MYVIYEILNHKHFATIAKAVGAVLVVATSYWYFVNFDKIMGTAEGKKQIIREREEKKDEELLQLATEGGFHMSKIPKMAPLSYEAGGGWESLSSKKTTYAPINTDKSTHAPRIEKGRSNRFVEGLLIVDNMRVVSGREETGMETDASFIRALMSNKAKKPFVDAKIDIIFVDGKERILLRRSINPLVVSGGLFGDKVKPLYPGESREFVVDASQPPSGWTNQIRTEVVYYQFSQ